MTGNVQRFVTKLDMPNIKISESLVVEEPFVLVTYTTGFGKVPEQVFKFLENNHHNLRGVAASGNRNWGDMFARSADVIASRYILPDGKPMPILHKFEMSGTQEDVDLFKERVQEVDDQAYRIKQ